MTLSVAEPEILVWALVRLKTSSLTPAAISEKSLREVADKRDSRYMQWSFDVLDHWLSCEDEGVAASEERVEREGGKGGEPAEHAGRQEEAKVLTAARINQGEIAGEEAHQEAADDVHRQRSHRKTRAEEAERAKINEVAASGADRAAQGDEQEMNHDLG